MLAALGRGLASAGYHPTLVGVGLATLLLAGGVALGAAALAAPLAAVLLGRGGAQGGGAQGSPPGDGAAGGGREGGPVGGGGGAGRRDQLQLRRLELVHRQLFSWLG